VVEGLDGLMKWPGAKFIDGSWWCLQCGGAFLTYPIDANTVCLHCGHSIAHDPHEGIGWKS
jgi:hypothetical protein